MGEPEDIRDDSEDARAGRLLQDDADPVVVISDYDDPRWRRVYAAVIVFAAIVIAALWAFSRAFSS